jgi:hypothetical protein
MLTHTVETHDAFRFRGFDDLHRPLFSEGWGQSDKVVQGPGWLAKLTEDYNAPQHIAVDGVKHPLYPEPGDVWRVSDQLWIGPRKRSIPTLVVHEGQWVCVDAKGVVKIYDNTDFINTFMPTQD